MRGIEGTHELSRNAPRRGKWNEVSRSRSGRKQGRSHPPDIGRLRKRTRPWRFRLSGRGRFSPPLADRLLLASKAARRKRWTGKAKLSGITPKFMHTRQGTHPAAERRSPGARSRKAEPALNYMPYSPCFLRIARVLYSPSPTLFGWHIITEPGSRHCERLSETGHVDEARKDGGPGGLPMAFRFRRALKLLPRVRLNLKKAATGHMCSKNAPSGRVNERTRRSAVTLPTTAARDGEWRRALPAPASAD
jgi:hypothetical protein